MKSELLLLTFFTCLSSLVHGSSPVSPYPYFHLSSGNPGICLEVVPLNNGFDAKIRCMTMDWDNNGMIARRQMWEVETNYPYPGLSYPYSDGIFLSSNGEAMVCLRVPDNITYRVPPENWILLEFYVKGKLIANTRLSEVIEISSIKNDDDSFTFKNQIFDKRYKKEIGIITGRSGEASELDLPAKYEIGENDYLFQFRTAQNHLLVFRMSDGKLILKKKILSSVASDQKVNRTSQNQ